MELEPFEPLTATENWDALQRPPKSLLIGGGGLRQISLLRWLGQLELELEQIVLLPEVEVLEVSAAVEALQTHLPVPVQVIPGRASDGELLQSLPLKGPVGVLVLPEASEEETLLTLASVLTVADLGRVGVVMETEEGRQQVLEWLPDAVVFVENDFKGWLMANSLRPDFQARCLEGFCHTGDLQRFAPEGGWQGMRFGEAQLRAFQGQPVGIRFPDGRIFIAPPPTTELQGEDELLIWLPAHVPLDFQATPATPQVPRLQPQDPVLPSGVHLVVRWTPAAEPLLVQLAELLPDGSVLHVLSEPRVPLTAESVQNLQQKLPGLPLKVRSLDIQDPKIIRALKLNQYASVLVLTPDDGEQAWSLSRQLQRQAQQLQARPEWVVDVRKWGQEAAYARAGIQAAVPQSLLLGVTLRAVLNPEQSPFWTQLVDSRTQGVRSRAVETLFPESTAALETADLVMAAQTQGEVFLGVLYGEESTETGRIEWCPGLDRSFVLAPSDQIITLGDLD